jgi:peptidoglycan hydrolase-like protein with peptidoglycan-binding domain
MEKQQNTTLSEQFQSPIEKQQNTTLSEQFQSPMEKQRNITLSEQFPTVWYFVVFLLDFGTVPTV